jgi:serine/threonine protein kinase
VTAGELNLLKSTHHLTNCGGVALVGAGVPKTWKVSDIILNLYRVTELLGEGGFGKVYKVRHTGWNIDLAVKIPKPEIVAAKGGADSFEREALSVGQPGAAPPHRQLLLCEAD